MSEPQATTKARGLAGIIRHELQLFREHFAAYFILFLVKIGLFVIILKMHKSAGIKGEVIPAIVLATVGIGMTVLFQRNSTSKPTCTQASK